MGKRIYMSWKLVNTYDLIVSEDLQIQNIMANYHLAESISDAGWYQLISLTKSKAEYAGKVVELVDPEKHIAGMLLRLQNT